MFQHNVSVSEKNMPVTVTYIYPAANQVSPPGCLRGTSNKHEMTKILLIYHCCPTHLHNTIPPLVLPVSQMTYSPLLCSGHE